MLIKDSEAIERLGSPLNLMNRLKNTSPRSKAMGLFVPSASQKSSELPFSNPFDKTEVKESEVVITRESASEVTTDDLIGNADKQIQLSQAHDTSLELLNLSLAALKNKIDDVPASKLPGVITATSKVVEGIRKERNEVSKATKGREVHLHFYTPVQKNVSDYAVIDV